MGFHNTALIGASSQGYQIARSVRLRSSATAYFNRTPATASNRKTWTWSGWVKRGKLSSYQRVMTVTVGSDEHLIFRDSDVFHYYSGNAVISLITTQLFRDPAAWYHLVVAIDTTQATSSNRAKIYVNGVQVTAFSTATYPSQNADTSMNNALPHGIGGPDSSQYLDGYLTEVQLIDGQALTPSSFGETNYITGVWQPKKYAGTYGTNGFYLNFSDNSGATATTIGKDNSGNGNNWTPNNISVTAGVTYDSMTDVPTLTSATAANYAVMNPLSTMGSGNSLTNGNLTFAGNGSSNIITTGTFGMSSGKWYVEATITNGGGGVGFGIAKDTEPRGSATVGNTVATWGYNGLNGVIANDSSTLSTGATYTTGDVVAFALDMDAGTLVFYKNNASQGSTVTGLSGTFLVAVSGYLSTINANFGQRPFTYTPPTGFVALNTYNLPASTITNGAAYMAATTYTGTGAALTVSNAVNGVGMQSDLVWLKSRSVARDHRLMDSVRGINNVLLANLTIAEYAGSALSSINSNGFTLNTSDNQNISAETYVGWQWKAGGTAVSNTDGTITSSVSAGATQGFSVVTYTHNGTNSATVGHGLGVTPSFIINKQRSAISNWRCYHVSLSAGYNIQLNLTQAQSVAGDIFQTAPTSSVFTPGNGDSASGQTMVAYCFAAVAGYSAFGSYTGNGSTDGPFVYLGFRPRFIMFKCSTSAGTPWVIVDTSRNPSNAASLKLAANNAEVENGSVVGNTTENLPDINSNGFKMRSVNTSTNGSGETIIYMAFAENPFKLSLAR